LNLVHYSSKQHMLYVLDCVDSRLLMLEYYQKSLQHTNVITIIDVPFRYIRNYTLLLCMQTLVYNRFIKDVFLKASSELHFLFPWYCQCQTNYEYRVNTYEQLHTMFVTSNFHTHIVQHSQQTLHCKFG